MTQHIETRQRLKAIASVQELNELLDKCVLSDEDRLIFELHYIKGKPLGYIADELGYSESCIKKRHCKIIGRLEKML